MLAITRVLTGRSVGLVAFETILIVSAIVSAAFVRFGAEAPEFIAEGDGIIRFLVVAVVLQTCLYYGDLYNIRMLADRRELFVRLVQALAVGSFLLAGIYYVLPTLIIGRGVFVIAALFLVVLIPGWRLVFEWLSRNMRPRERLLLVGTSVATVDLARELFERRHELGVEIVGFVDPDPAQVGAPVINPGVIGMIEDIPSIVRARGVDRVVVSLADSRGKLPVDKLLEMKLDGVTFDHLASIYEQYTGKIAVENLRPSWLIFSPGFKKSRLLSLAKRMIDVVVAGIGVVLTLPLMALVALAIRVTSKGPVLYHQRRVGLQGRIFVLHKFRSMRTDAETETGPVWASKQGDNRVTPLGSLLAKDSSGRIAAVVECASWRHEFRRSSTRASRVRERVDEGDPLLSSAARATSRAHRLGAGTVHVRRERGRRPAEAAVRLVLYQAHVDLARPVHHLLDNKDRHSAKRCVMVGLAQETGTPLVVNAMSIDVEDYFHVSVFDGIVARSTWDAMESRVCRNTERLLDIFDEFKVRSTFFVLGWVAERHPHLVREIAQRGHELASHGYAHRLIYDQTPRCVP